MQALTNKLISGQKGWPPQIETILREGVLLCIGLGVPIAALLYDSQKKGTCEHSRKERERISGIIRAMIKRNAADKTDYVNCQRIFRAIKSAKEEGEDQSQLELWTDDLTERVANALANAVAQNDEKAVMSLSKILDKNPYSWSKIPKQLNRSLDRMLRMSFRRRLRTLWTLVVGPARYQLKWILLNVVVAIVSGVLKSLNLRYYLKAQEAARLGRGGSELVSGLLATLVMYILDVLMEVLRQQCANRGAGEISVQLQRRLFAKLLTADCMYHDVNYKLADKIYLLREAANLDQKLLRLPIDLATLCASLGARYYTLGRMSVRLLVAVGVFVPVSSWIATKAELWVTQQLEALRHATERRRAADARILGNQLLTVRSFVQERIEAEQFERFLRYKGREESKACVLSAIAKLAHLLPLCGRLGALLYGSQLVSEGWMTPLQLEEFVTAHDIATADLSSLKTMIPALWAAIEPAARIVEVLNLNSTIERPLTDPIQTPPWRRNNARDLHAPFSIEFKDVWFSYPNRPDVTVLRGVSFMIKAGAKVAIVGPSGSGKSTVLALIQRFYEISSGQILIEGHDIREYDPRWLRKLVAVVSQRCVVFPRDVISNISLGDAKRAEKEDTKRAEKEDTNAAEKEDTNAAEKKSAHLSRSAPSSLQFKLDASGTTGGISEMRVIEGGVLEGGILEGDEGNEDPKKGVPGSIIAAAKTANASTFIENLPEGYHTQLGEGGIELSGGQQQRIAIARAIEKRPALLLLDEAFANLDASSEASVLGALKALVEARPQTVVTVAHQLSTIAWSDEIICMDAGVVREVGSHTDLMKKKGIYHTMYMTQQSSLAGQESESGISSVNENLLEAKQEEDDMDLDQLPLPELKLLRASTLPVLRRSRSDVLSLCGN